eukprot:8821797-Pyramimonas_sp.AAC.1
MDQGKLNDTEQLAKFAAILNSTPVCHWTVDVNQHSEVTDSFIVAAARSCFQMDRQTANQPYITRSTMRLVRLRRYVARARRWLPIHNEHSPPWKTLLEHATDPLLTSPDAAWEVDAGLLLLAMSAVKTLDISYHEFGLALSRFLASTAP